MCVYTPPFTLFFQDDMGSSGWRPTLEAPWTGHNSRSQILFQIHSVESSHRDCASSSPVTEVTLPLPERLQLTPGHPSREPGEGPGRDMYIRNATCEHSNPGQRSIDTKERKTNKDFFFLLKGLLRKCEAAKTLQVEN